MPAHRSHRHIVFVTFLLLLSVLTVSITVIAYQEVISKPIQLPAADRIVSLLGVGPTRGLSWPDGWSTPALSDIGVFQTVKLNIGEDRQETILACVADVGFFRVLAIGAKLGRLFTNDDAWIGAPPVAIVSDSFWRSHFGDGADLSTATFFAAGRRIQVVGVLPPTVDFPAHASVYLPHPDRALRLSASNVERWPADDVSRGNDRIIARLRSGVTVAQADGMEKALLERIRKANTDPHRGFGVVGVRRLRDTMTFYVQEQLTTVVTAGCLVATVALFSLFFLSAARASELRKDIAIRIALGAAVTRLFWREIIWWLCVGSLTSIAALALTELALKSARKLEGLAIPRLGDLTLTFPQAIGIIAGIMTIAILLSIPYLLACRKVEPVTPVLNRGDSLSHLTVKPSVGKAVSFGQLSLAIALTGIAITAGISYRRIADTPPGINPSRVFVSDSIPVSALNLGNQVTKQDLSSSSSLNSAAGANPTIGNAAGGSVRRDTQSSQNKSVGSNAEAGNGSWVSASAAAQTNGLFDLQAQSNQDVAIREYVAYQELIQAAEETSRQPDVSNVALIGPVPYGPTAGSGQFIQVKGKPSERALPVFAVHGNVPDVLGMRILEGRWFNGEEEKTGTNVIVVGDALSKEYFEGHALRKSLVVEGTGDSGPRTVIGVVDDVVPDYGQGIGPAMYIPAVASLRGASLTSLIVSMAPGVARSPFPVRNAAANLLLFQPWTSMEKMMSDAGATDRASATVAAWFAILVLLLSAAGAYAVFWMITIQRQREMAIRICFGAFPSRVAAGMVLNAAMLAACAGVGGILIEYALERALSSKIYQFPVFSWTTFLVSFSVIAVATLLSVARPAMSILRISPAELLRNN